jgi:caa(3)-type oxidase subunit IV
MTTLLLNKVSLAWSVLVVLTLAQWTIGSHITSNGPHTAAGVVIFVVATFKARLVGLYFMELRTAPWALRGVFELFCLAMLGVLSAMYVLG